MHTRPFQLIGAASGWGAQIRTCEEGPEVLLSTEFLRELKSNSISISDLKMVYPITRFKDKKIPLSEALPLIAEFNHRLSETVYEALENDHFPVVIGGDHSIAVGTWNGVMHFFSQWSSKPFGLIWIDAHMDSHTTETTPSGAWHGMPLASLMGFGKMKMIGGEDSGRKIEPGKVCLIGCRSFEEAERQLLEKQGVRVYFMNEVTERGFGKVVKEAIEYVSQDTLGYGVSIDLDVMNPVDAPGVGSPATGGIVGTDFLTGISQFCGDPHLKGIEIVEFNPPLDVENKTEKLFREILKRLLRGKAANVSLS